MSCIHNTSVILGFLYPPLEKISDISTVSEFWFSDQETFKAKYTQISKHLFIF